MQPVRTRLKSQQWAAESPQHLYTIQARAGPGDPSPVSYSWVVDTQAPSTTIVLAPAAEHSHRRAGVAFEADEAGCTFLFRVRSAEAGGGGVGPLEPDVDPLSWPNATTAGFVELGPEHLADAARHAFDVAAIDRAGNLGAVTSASWSVEKCAPVPDVSITRVESIGDGTAQAVWIETSAAFVETRLVPASWGDGDGPTDGSHADAENGVGDPAGGGVFGAGMWRRSPDKAFLVAPSNAQLEQVQAGGAGDIASLQWQVRAEAENGCVPRDTGRPAAAAHTWTPPHLHVGPMSASIAKAPNALSSLRTTTFEFEVLGAPGAADVEQSQLEVAYGFNPSQGAATAVVSAGSPAWSGFTFAGGSAGGSQPVWRQAERRQRIGPVALGSHIVLVRAVDAVTGDTDPDAPTPGGVVAYRWVVRSADASLVSITGLTTGVYTLAIRATDAAGNLQADGTHQEFEWEVDNTAPGTSATRSSPVLALTSASTASVDVSCLHEAFPERCTYCWTPDAARQNAGTAALVSGLAATAVGGGVPDPAGVDATAGCTAVAGANVTLTITVPPGLAFEGMHIGTVAARDATGNVDATPVSVQWSVDRLPPTVTDLVVPAAGDQPLGAPPSGRHLPVNVTVLVDGARDVAISSVYVTRLRQLQVVATVDEAADSVAFSVHAIDAWRGLRACCELPSAGVLDLAQSTVSDFADVGTGDDDGILPAFSFAGIPVTLHVVTATATDLVGNVGGGSATDDAVIALLVDVVAPTATITINDLRGVGPAGVALVNTSHVTISLGVDLEAAGAAELVAAFHVSYVVDNVNGAQTTEDVTAGFADDSGASADGVEAPVSAADATATIEVHDGVVHGSLVTVVVAVEDWAGNVGLEEEVQFAVDVAAPLSEVVTKDHVDGSGVPGMLNLGGVVVPEPPVATNAANGIHAAVAVSEAACTVDAELYFVPPPAGGELTVHPVLVAWQRGVATVTLTEALEPGAFDIEPQSVATIQFPAAAAADRGDGAYLLSVTATDAAGNVQAHPTEYHFVVDRTPPVVTVIPSVAPHTRVSEWALVLACNDATGCAATVSVSTVASDGLITPLRQLHLSLAAGAGDTASVDVGPTVAGARYTVVVEATDGARNAVPPATVEAQRFTWVHDDTSPTLEVTQWQVLESPTDASGAIVRGIADANTLVAAIDADPVWVFDSEATADVPGGIGSASGSGSGSNGASAAVLPFSNQVTGFSVRCADDVDSSGCAVRARLRLLAQAQQVCAGVDNSGGAGAGAGGSGESIDSINPFEVWTTVVDTRSTGVVSLGALAATADAADVAEAGGVTGLLPDGLYELRVDATDDAGNVYNTSSVFRWHVDSTPPLAPTLSAEQLGGRSLTGDSFLVVALEALDTSPLLSMATLLVSLSGTELQLAGQPPGVAASGQQASSALAVNDAGTTATAVLGVGNTPAGTKLPIDGADAELPDGSYALTVSLVDAAGNVGKGGILSWQVQSAEPTAVPFIRPADTVGRTYATIGFAALWLDPLVPLEYARFEINLGGTAWRLVCDARSLDPRSAFYGQDQALEGVLVPRGPNHTMSGCVYNVPSVDIQTYTLQVRVINGLNLQSEPAAIVWSRGECTGTQYAVINETDGGLRCVNCPEGADCSGALVTKLAVGAQQGYWASDEGFSSGSLLFYRCPRPESCVGAVRDANGTVVRGAACAAGYAGRLCSQCDDGYFLQFGACIECPKTEGGTWGAIVGITIALCVFAFVVIRYRALLPIPIVKIVVAFAQISSSANSALTIPWPAVFASFLNTMKVALLDLLTITQAGCAAPMTFYDSFGLTMGIFVGVSIAGIAGLAWRDTVQRRQAIAEHEAKVLAQRSAVATQPRTASAVATIGATARARGSAEAIRRGTHARRRSTAQVIASALSTVVDTPSSLLRLRWELVFKKLSMFWLLCYPGVSVKLLRVFKCVQVEGDWWLEADLRLACFTPAWGTAAFFSSVLIVVFTVGMPVGITVWLWRNRATLSTPETQEMLGFLYADSYGEETYFWEVAELIRKLILTSLVIFFDAGSPLQVAFALLVSAYAHVAHASFHPFRGRDPRAYYLQHFALTVTTFMFAMGLLFKVQGFASDTAHEDDESGTASGGGDTEPTPVSANNNSTVTDGLGVMLVLLCVSFLATAFVLGATDLVRNLRRAMGGSTQKGLPTQGTGGRGRGFGVHRLRAALPAALRGGANSGRGASTGVSRGRPALATLSEDGEALSSDAEASEFSVANPMMRANSARRGGEVELSTLSTASTDGADASASEAKAGSTHRGKRVSSPLDLRRPGLSFSAARRNPLHAKAGRASRRNGSAANGAADSGTAH